METTPEIVRTPVSAPAVAPDFIGTPKTTPRDFFYWLGFIVALYSAISALIALLFDYINIAYPDVLAYSGDVFNGSIRFEMATLIVMTPTAMLLAWLIRRSIATDPSKEKVWVRKWALILTIFLASLALIIDLITLLTTFLGGEISTRFLLKVAIVLLVAVGVFLHFIADNKGYWIEYPKKALSVAFGVLILSLVVIVSGFLIIGSPTKARMVRFDEQKVSDLRDLQYRITNYYQLKRSLPVSLSVLTDQLNSYTVPVDPQTMSGYEYSVVKPLSFSLCATFNERSQDTTGQGAYPANYGVKNSLEESFGHAAGRVCFLRTIDPELYPVMNQNMVPTGKGI